MKQWIRKMYESSVIRYIFFGAEGYEEKSQNPDENIKSQEFCGKMMLFHGFFTSNLYPIPHTVAMDQ